MICSMAILLVMDAFAYGFKGCYL